MYPFQLFLMLSHWAYRYLIWRCKQKTDDEEEQEEQETATTTVPTLKFKGTPPPLDSFLEDKPKNSQLKALQKGFFASLSNFSSCICIGNSNNKLPSLHFPGSSKLQLPQMQVLIVLSFVFVFFWFCSSKNKVDTPDGWVTPFIPAECKFVNYFFSTKIQLNKTDIYMYIYSQGVQV